MSHTNKMKICRACLTTKDVFTYFLFENVSVETYWYCTSVKVLRDEELPLSLCNTCYGLLMNFLEFKKTCIQSQNTLLNIKNTTAQKISSFDDSLINVSRSNEEDKPNLSMITVKIEDTSDANFSDDVFDDTQENYYDQSIIKTKDKLHKRLKKPSKIKQNVNVIRKYFIFQCDICNKKFKYIQRLNAHKLEHETKVVSLQCDVCTKPFKTWSGLKRHNESQHTPVNLDSLRCSVCGRICKTRQTLAMHMKIHGERNLFMCDACGKQFTTKVILQSHLETHEENRERRFTCEHCGKKFFTNTILTSHVSRRHTQRRFICHLCNYPFTTKYNLSKHLLVHDGKKLYKCDVCEKVFARQTSLVEHKRIHSGEKPFPCSYCPMSFISKRRLAEHHRMHTGDKPHKCDLCEQRFTQRGTLTRHMKVHDRPMPIVN